MVAMPCCEVVEVGGALDIFHLVNERLARDTAVASAPQAAGVRVWDITLPTARPQPVPARERPETRL
jgi:hypothetical protein